MISSKQPLRGVVDGPDGFALGWKLNPEELIRTRQLIESQWRQRIEQCAPQFADRFAERGMARYHELSDLIDHRRLWPKLERVLSPSAVDELCQMAFFRRLETEFGKFQIADEESLGRQNVYWRIVRPGEPSDVGPVHADCWFWQLGHGIMPAGRQRVKVWIALICDTTVGALQVAPGSHLREWSYHGQQRDGMWKPQIDEDVATLNLQLLPTLPGDAVIFHDKLLHGGAVNQSSLTRVSLEFTMLVRPS